MQGQGKEWMKGEKCPVQTRERTPKAFLGAAKILENVERQAVSTGD